jgi:Redoxin
MPGRAGLDRTGAILDPRLAMPFVALLPVVLSVALLPFPAVAQPAATAGVVDPRGRAVAPLSPGAPATVLIFTAVDCPISDRYAPEVTRLAARHAAAGVRVWIVYANAGELPAAARAHAEAFGYGLPIALDTRAALADRAGVSVTPEAAVFDASGRVVYRGRIDDRYTDFGVDRPSPARRDLAEALADVLAGRPVAMPTTRAIGCAIVREP